MSCAVLLVDDEVEFTTILAKVLARRGLVVQVAASGDAALALLRERAFPVVVLDVRMPGTDGLSVLAEIRQSLPETQVILMTGHLAQGEEDRCRTAGAFAYVLKPYPTDKLAELIESALPAGAAGTTQPEGGGGS